MNPIDLSAFIRDVPDFPSDGVLFKDITPMLASSAAFPVCIDGLAAAFEGERVDKVIGVEARGFILAAPVALRLRAGFVPVRKPGKLPAATARVEYDLDYIDNWSLGLDIYILFLTVLSPKIYRNAH